MATTLQEAKSYAAIDGIRYMATDQTKVVKNSNYDELQEQIKNSRLEHKLQKKDQKLAKRGGQLTKAVTTSEILIDKVFDSAQRIQEIVSKSLAPHYAAIDGKLGAALLEVHNVVAELKQHEDEAMGRLTDTGAYPLYADFSRDDVSSDNSTDRENARATYESLYFDSKGEELYEEEALLLCPWLATSLIYKCGYYLLFELLLSYVICSILPGMSDPKISAFCTHL